MRVLQVKVTKEGEEYQSDKEGWRGLQADTSISYFLRGPRSTILCKELRKLSLVFNFLAYFNR